MINSAMKSRVVLLTALLLTGCGSILEPAAGSAPQESNTPARQLQSVQEDIGIDGVKSEGTVPADSKITAREIKGTVTPPPPKPNPPSHPSLIKPETLIGSAGKELITRFGQPNITMDVKVAGQRTAEGYLYYPKDGKGCIHHFIVSTEKNKIIDYFCR
ncbi:MAG: hypothetical protein H7834_08765 [Magnetococcus sp. YQC-9]